MLSRLCLASRVVKVKIQATKPNEQQTHTITPEFTRFPLLHFSRSCSQISLAHLVYSIPCYAFCYCTLTFHQVIIASKQPKISCAITLLMTMWRESGRMRTSEEGSSLTTIRAITMKIQKNMKFLQLIVLLRMCILSLCLSYLFPGVSYIPVFPMFGSAV